MPTIIVELIVAAGKLAPTLFERFTKNASEAKKVDELVAKKYDDLKKLLSPTCVRILVYAEDGDYHHVLQYRSHVYPRLQFASPDKEKVFDNEFEYRLRYLDATGFLTAGLQQGYYITQLGGSFLAKARQKRDFSDVLFNRGG